MNTIIQQNIEKLIPGSDISDILQQAVDCISDIRLPAGRFIIGKTIFLKNNCHIRGSGEHDTELFLASDVNNNMFTNADYLSGNFDIKLENLIIDGNLKNQRKPESENRISFCNAVYLARCSNCSFINISVKNFLQTALHFNRSNDIRIEGLSAENLGWSGISTSGTDNIRATNFFIYDSGKDHRHSAIHLDGGRGAFLQGRIDQCVGNGVMLDSTFSDFSQCVVQVEVSNCMRGISLIGSDKSQPSSVSINETHSYKNDIGIMISNARHAFINDCLIESNKDFGILFQGRVGGCDSFVSNCTFENNKKNIKEIHQSNNNFFFSNYFLDDQSEVIKGKDNILFLTKSTHKILDHLRRKIEIPQESIENFSNNIKRRRAYCSKHGITYRHVIFPDKISALQQSFPIKNLRTYSDIYRKYYDETVLDLLEHISEKPKLYLRTDTHLSFNGMLETSSIILREFLPIDTDEIRESLKEFKGEEHTYLGDLGSKVNPEETETHYHFKTPNLRRFDNMVGANDGLCHVYFNKEKLKTNSFRRLLVFGDSFMERCLPLIANFYSDVLFCRSRYFHEEIVDMFRPDDLITSSAERYFSYVRLDEVAPRFDLIYGTRNFNYSSSTEFYKAYNAALSYGRPAYKAFVDNLLGYNN